MHKAGRAGSAEPPDRTVLMRLRERLRYGLLTQELLDRLPRFGLLFYPYYLVREAPSDAPRVDEPPPSITFSKLEHDRAALVAGLPCRRLDVERVVRRMDEATCFGAFDGPELVGYTWARLSSVPTVSGRDVLFRLGDDGAYLHDMYIARAHRGKRLAPWLRQRVHEALANEGRRAIYSHTLGHNRSSRRFKARLGAKEIEKRLAFGIIRLRAYDVRLASLTPEPLPSNPRVRLRGWAPSG